MTPIIPINRQWVDIQMRELCEKHRNAPLPKCPRFINEEARVHWMNCAECVAESFIGIDGAVFRCPVPGWCNPDTSALHNCLQKSLRNIDWLLHLSKKRYRDHASHQLFVGALGSFLLQCKVDTSADRKGQNLQQWIAKKLSLEEEEVEVAWWISSLLHDHAYPLGHMLMVTPSLVGMDVGAKRNFIDHTWTLLGFKSDSYCENSALQGLYDHELLGKLRDAIQPNKPEERRKELFDVLKIYLESFFTLADGLNQAPMDCYDHGILAAANLAALMPCSSRDSRILKWVIRAIGIHNGAACHEYIDAENDPLAFLLVLCDEFQEWERQLVVKDDIVYESTQMLLGDFREPVNGDYAIGECLTAIFEFPYADILEKTEWNYSQFSSSKNKALCRLRVSGDFPIKGVKYHIQMPYERQFSTPCTPQHK